MTDTFKATVQLKTSVQQLLDATAAPAAGTPQITHAGWDFSHALSASTTPPFTKHAAFQQALAAGVATIDLTALVGLNGEAVDGTGLRVQTLKLRNPSTNANSISIEPGAANPYDLCGADFKITLEPGTEVLIFCLDTAPEISATDCEIDLAGTLVQALDVEILMG